ncbi:nitroreductase family protein [Thermosulfuriphilus ammonigenes]|uniref:Nitroreductase family protein n=1 Tax=Thermosulfuriphilus ammonigenes TaxID=1936021 RepID=A0A6G7PTR2_9BACT|nr:nitroreductase [Thermosulfuriphilus ammonigenes]MBA2848798.1 nitroreductase [Thermosulfuriphilus ammonigenes]QIJ71074.1 nitroreductase family protein [Thermosulfuriphilus ammonigenes]
MDNPVLKAIYSRRSVRDYTTEPVDRETVLEIIKAGTWAPSGLNNQPWRFAIVWNKEIKDQIASLTKYRVIIERAPVIICVFVDKEAMYHEVKDHQAMGACIQNMLLATHALGLGGVWLGEILKNADKVRKLLDLPEALDLMAVIALGHPKHRNQRSTRRPLSEVILKEV